MRPLKPQVLLLHHKERDWTSYVRKYSSLNQLENDGVVKVSVTSLPQKNSDRKFAELPEAVRSLLFFAKPDLIICLDDGRKPVQAVFALDVTEHVAARDHWIQRFPNLVGCAQNGIPGAFVAPRDMPNRPGFAGKTDPFFFFAYDRVMEIHETPIYIAEWPSADGSNLDSDDYFHHLPPHTSSGMRSTILLLDLALEAAMKGQNLRHLSRNRIIVDLRHEVRRLGYGKIPDVNDFDRIYAPKGRLLTRAEFNRWLLDLGLKVPDSIPDRIKKRDRHLIFRPLVKYVNPEAARTSLNKRIKEKGGDPYTQQPIVFDYLFCRLGPSPMERDTNLVIDLSVLQFSDFAQYIASAWKGSPLRHLDFASVVSAMPTYALHLTEGIGQEVKNFVRLYAHAADYIVFREGLIHL